MKRVPAILTRFPRLKRQPKRITIRAVVLNTDGLWTVQGLEYDMAAQGKTPHEAVISFQCLIGSWVEIDREAGRKPFSALPRAPQKFWDIFEQGLTLKDPHEDHRSMKFNPNIVSTPELRLCSL